MSKQRLFLINLFFLVIPYLLLNAMAAIAYNCLVFHSHTWSRTFVAGFLGAILLSFLKRIIVNPLLVLKQHSASSKLTRLYDFLLIDQSRLKLMLNGVSNFLMICLATYLVRFITTFSLANTLMGWCLAALIISVGIAVYIGFDMLSPQSDLTVENN